MKSPVKIPLNPMKSPVKIPSNPTKSHENSVPRAISGRSTSAEVVQLLLKHADEESADNNGCPGEKCPGGFLYIIGDLAGFSGIQWDSMAFNAIQWHWIGFISLIYYQHMGMFIYGDQYSSTSMINVMGEMEHSAHARYILVGIIPGIVSGSWRQK